ncbi:MAG: type II toxin-antitoxin system RelE/ParE family toxin [Planctomycetaceae bacterium]|nr:type II toxin-antitoxin system RelE/ParE family toxin [Planctomycetaceae bacterium]
MTRLLITESAQADLDQIWLFIARDNPAAADHFLDRLISRCQSYANQPLLGERRPDVGSGVRCFSIGHYVVFYLPLVDGVQVVRVIHGARDIREL